MVAVNSRLPACPIALVFLLMLPCARGPGAETPRVLPPGKLPADARLGELRTLNGYFPMQVPKTPEAWAEREERLRRQLRMATGLWPMPTKTPAKAVIHGRVDRDDYTVEKVCLQSFPGHFVTGNLYRPKGRTGPGPGVLCPHGHWPNGRFYDAGEKKIEQEIEAKAEKFDPSGRYPIQARCVQLARMGCTVFHYDMVGYADSRQLAHRPGFRKEMNAPENWGYFSPQAEARMQNMMGLQTYNSIRVLDWFGDLPEVDPKRIGVTGGSGGGTQTFMLCAIDKRPAVAFPAVMVSTAMQGGCTCENACYLRVGAGNIDLAALIAPRPLGMTGANDWTIEIETKGLPELKQLYTMLGVPELVMARHFSFPHNYNCVSRSAMYSWMNRHLKLGRKEPIVEEDYRPLTKEEMTVWDDEHPRPPSGADYERSLLRWITKDSEKQMAALVPKDKKSLAEFRRVVGGAVDAMIGRRLPKAEEVESIVVGEEKKDGYTLVKLLLRYKPAGEEVPAVLVKPDNWDNKELVIWIDRQGKRGLFDKKGRLPEGVQGGLQKKDAVLALDLFGQGEFTADGKPLAKQRINKSGRGDWASYAGYTYGYNHPVFAKRVHDILTVVACVRDEKIGADHVSLIGVDGAGHWVAAARAQARGAVDLAVADTTGFRFAGLTEIDDPDFLPGGAKYFDLPGMLALSAPHELIIRGEKTPAVVAAAYKAAGAEGKLGRSTRIPGPE